MMLDRAAEQVVIGAILLQPRQFEEVREWLTPDDFDGTAERQAYQAICDLDEAREPVSPGGVDRQIRTSSRPGPVVADAAFVVACMQRCPEPSRAPVYGRMVLELSIRRHVAERAVGLRQRARAATTSAELNRVFGEVDSVRREVERLHEREALAAQSKSPTPLIV
jgi:replicative DNA helicase